MANLEDLDMSDAGELQEGFEPFPAGEYEMYLEDSERKTNNAGDGEYLNCTFVVKGGEYDGRKVFHIFNLWNKSAKALEIAKREWRGLCEASVGQPNSPNGDSSGVHYKPFIGTVIVEPAVFQDDGKTIKWPAKNKMSFRKGTVRSLAEQGSAPVGVAAPQKTTQTAAPAQASAPAAAATASRPSWAKK